MNQDFQLSIESIIKVSQASPKCVRGGASTKPAAPMTSSPAQIESMPSSEFPGSILATTTLGRRRLGFQRGQA